MSGDEMGAQAVWFLFRHVHGFFGKKKWGSCPDREESVSKETAWQSENPMNASYLVFKMLGSK